MIRTLYINAIWQNIVIWYFSMSWICPLSLGAVVAMIIWQLDIQLPMRVVPITTDAVSSNLDQGEVYNIM